MKQKIKHTLRPPQEIKDFNQWAKYIQKQINIAFGIKVKK
jgi:hypothetical protein